MDERSARRRSTSTKPVPPYRNKRFLAILAAALTFGAFVTVTQVSNAGERRRGGQRPPAAWPCPTATSNGGTTQQGGAAAQGQEQVRGGGTGPNDPVVPSTTQTDGPGDTPSPSQSTGVVDGGVQNGRQVRNYPGDGGDDNARTTGRDRRGRNCTPTLPATGGTSGSASPSASSTTAPPANIGDNDLLGTDCGDSGKSRHTGLQEGDKCVNVSHGEVPTAANSPSLLITAAPNVVRQNQPFTIQFSTRNLVRDRFLAAARAGYYREMSFLTEDGLVRGHVHTACRMLTEGTRVAPNAGQVPAFFLATEDGGGGETPDTITISVPGLAQTGIAQCAVWAGDGSHRTPMMEKAQFQPAFDTVRIRVLAGRN